MKRTALICVVTALLSAVPVASAAVHTDGARKLSVGHMDGGMRTGRSLSFAASNITQNVKPAGARKMNLERITHSPRPRINW